MFKKSVLSSIVILSLFLLTQGCIAQKITANDQKRVENTNVPLFIENESKYNFTETIEKLTAEIEKSGWKIPIVHDLQATLKKSGTVVLPVKVFELCHPKYASKILLNDDDRIVSSLMPCRISIYEKSNGKTYISSMNSADLSKMMGQNIEEVMTGATKEVDEILKKFIIEK